MASFNIATNGAEHQESAEQNLTDDGNENNDVNRTSKLNSAANGNNGQSVTITNPDLARPESNGALAVSLRAGSPNSTLEQNEECQETKSKIDKIREVVEQSTSDDSKKKIERILADVQQLSDLEKLLLYLRLPTGTKVEVDPLKQAFVSSLGNRYEVTQTVTWIQTHLEEDSEVSLPKQEVYDGYCEFCHRVKMKPLSTADFGKVMKQVFPTVRPRRLGTRGNSRYCYAGLRKKLSLDVPELPDLSLTRDENYEDCDPRDPDSTVASSYLIREWAEKLLGQKFLNLKELACHLVQNSYVHNRSVAAFALLSYLSENRQGKGSTSCALLNQCAGSKHRETQLQLQRKLQERELIREQKKKMLEQKNQLERCQSEKPASKSSRKGQLSRHSTDLSRSTTLTPLSENGPADCIAKHVGDNDSSKADDQKEELEGHISVSHEITEKVSTKSSSRRSSISETKVRSNSGDTPVHFHHDCRSVTASPCRRKSGDTSRGSSPRATVLDVGYNSNGGYRSLDDSFKVSSNGNNTSKISRGRTPDSLKGSASAPEASKTGKVLIPRVSSSQTSKMRFSTPTSIIILPPISSVPLTTDYGATQSKPKLKYKPIQPKPVHQRADSDEGKTNEGQLIEEKTSALDGSCRGRDRTINPNIRRDNTCSSSSNSSLSEIHLPSNNGGNTDGSLLGDCTPESCSNRRSKRSNEAQQGQRDCSKRPCHDAQECEGSEGHSQYKASREPESGSPQEDMSISTLENDAFMEFIHDTPSADQEDELLQYFGGDGVDRHPIEDEPIMATSLINHGTQSAELSQLRKLLERNFNGKNSLPQTETSDRSSLSDADCSKTDTQCEARQASASKDSMPTLRLLLSEQRQTPIGSLRSNAETARLMDCSHLLNGSTDDDDGGGNGRHLHSSSRIDSLFTQHYEQDVGHGESHVSNEDLEAAASQIENKPLRYLGRSSRQKEEEEEETWTYEAVKEAVKSEMQAQLASGAFLDTELSVAPQPLDVLDASQVDVLTDDQQENAQPINTEMTSFGVKPYPTCGNPVFVQRSESLSSVPPSPNTRVKAFNFMPISPRNTPVPETRSSTQSPLPYLVGGVSTGGHLTAALRSSIPQTPTTASSSQSACATASSSQPASATTSPFVSPRSTPSSLSRSRHNSGQASSSFGTPRATPHPVYAIDQPSCLTSSPFMSPHPTPVPFPTRSRHNSSQSAHRTCALPYSGSSNSASVVPSRSRHPSELGGINMLSPGSAPMSPLEHHGGICDTDISCGLSSGSHYPVMPSFGDAAPHMRSRHNSSSSIPPNSPRSAPMSPLVSASALIPQDSYSPDQNMPYGKSTVASSPGSSSLPPPPPPPPLAPPPPPPALQRHMLATSDVPHSDDRGKMANPLAWQGDIQRHTLILVGESGQQSQLSWASAAHHRQIDPRLVSRHRHASVGSASHHVTIPIHPHSQQAPHLDASSREVSQLMQKPLPAQLDSAQVCNRSQSVPLYEMLQYGLKQDEPPDTQFEDVLMSRSYPATPTGQQTFNFRTESSVDSGVASLGPAINSEFPDFNNGGRGGGEDGEQLYHGDQLGCEPARRSLSDALDLPPDQFQDMISSNLDDLISDGINIFAQELEQFASNPQP